MRKYLQLLALLVASAIPGAAMAATNYGIRISGTAVTSDNASNITGTWLRGGSIKYDYSSNVLTFTDADIFGDSGVTIENTCKNQLHLRFNGINNVSSNSVAFNIRKYDGYSRPDVFFETTEEGVLNINWHTGAGVETLYGGGIYCYASNGGAPWVTIGGDTRGAHTALTINATSINGGGDGRLVVEDGFLNLKGSAYCAIKGFWYVNFKGGAGRTTMMNDATYNSETQRLEKNGSIYTGAVNAGWQKYDVYVGGRQVHYQNKDDIRLFTQSNMSRAMKHYTQNQDAATGAIKYDPSSNTLTLTEVEILDGNNKAYGEAVIDNRTGEPFTLKTSGNARITTVYGKQKAAIRTNSDLTFTGGLFTARTNDTSSSCLLMDGNHLMATFDTGSRTNLEGTSETGNRGSAMDVATEGDKMRITTKTCTMELIGSCRNFEYWKFDGSAIQTANVFADEDRGDLCKRWNGNVSLQEYTTDIVPVTTSYGINVGGHALNDVNKNNFYYADVTGYVSYDPEENILTLENVVADCKHKIISDGKVKDVYWNGLNIYTSAASDLKIHLEGNNYFRNIDGVGMVVYKNTTLCGDGKLYLNKPKNSQDQIVYAPIYLYDGADLSLMETCQVTASEVVGSGGNGGNLNFYDRDYDIHEAQLWLYEVNRRHQTETIKGIKDIVVKPQGADGYGNVSSDIAFPNGGYYDTEKKMLLTCRTATGEGTAYRGNVHISPVTHYGFKVQGIEVTSYNAYDILNDTDFGYTGSLTYDAKENMLTMDNFKIASDPTLTAIEVLSTPGRWKPLHVKLIGENEFTDPGSILVRNGGINFQGSGTLNFPADIKLYRTESELEQMALEDWGYIGFTDCTVNARSLISTVSNKLGLVNGSLLFTSAVVNLSGKPGGTIIGFAYEPTFTADRITLPADAAWFDQTNPYNLKRETYITSNNVCYDGPVEIRPVYGITVADTEVTYDNKDDVLGDGGSVTFTPTQEDEQFEKVSYLTLKDATINGNIQLGKNLRDDEFFVRLEGQNTLNAGDSTGIQSQRRFIVWSDDAYGQLFVKGNGTGVELMNGAWMIVANAELNINVDAYGIKGHYTGLDEENYDRFEVWGESWTSMEPFYSKLVVKNSGDYPIACDLYQGSLYNVAVQEPAGAFFSSDKHGFVDGDFNLLAGTTLIISNDDYNTVGIGEMKDEGMKDEGMNNEKRAGAMYDLSGRKVNNARIQRGLYIVGGKKVAVK